MFKIMLFILLNSCCFAQPVEKMIDKDDSILPRAELMELSIVSSEDGNNVHELLKQLSAVLTNNLRQTYTLMADMKDMKTEINDMKDKIAEMTDMKEYTVRNEERIVNNFNAIYKVNSIAERNSDEVKQQKAN